MVESDPSKPFLIMGIVNLTPDSFSDGGKYFTPDSALSQALQLAEDGADIIDLGAVSTRPGAEFVSSHAEWARLEPVLEALPKSLTCRVKVSVDTSCPQIMRKALQYDVSYINNVSGLADPETLSFLAKNSKVSYLAMHLHQTPKTMQISPLKGDEALKEVEGFFSKAFSSLEEAGFSHDRIWLDPGIGFGKTDRANLLLMAKTPFFARKYQLALGVSRKSWLGRTLNISDPLERDKASKIAETALFMGGASMIRTHDVKGLDVFRRIVHQVET